MLDILVRPATNADIPAIYQLVKTLAVYEKEPDAVTATLEDYQRDFAADIFQAIIAEKEKQIIAMALYYMTYSTWKGRMIYLEDFVVDEEWRRKGVGQLIWNELKIYAKKRGAKLLKWQVLDWNEPAIEFYKKNNAIIETEWYNGKLFLE